MKETVYETFSAAETHALGKKIGETARPGDVYTLVFSVVSSTYNQVYVTLIFCLVKINGTCRRVLFCSFQNGLNDVCRIRSIVLVFCYRIPFPV